jgi:hypothetical protein
MHASRFSSHYGSERVNLRGLYMVVRSLGNVEHLKVCAPREEMVEFFFCSFVTI